MNKFGPDKETQQRHAVSYIKQQRHKAKYNKTKAEQLNLMFNRYKEELIANKHDFDDDGIFSDEISDVLHTIAEQTELKPYYIIEKIIDKLNGNDKDEQVLSEIEHILSEKLK